MLPQQGLDRVDVGIRRPGEWAVHQRDLIFSDDLQEPFAEHAVADQQNSLPPP